MIPLDPNAVKKQFPAVALCKQPSLPPLVFWHGG
jgi:hypothetical protein